MPADIVLRGVRVHNLKGVDVTIPTRKLVVVTGVSGSGKSSLAFDTLYAEGQRRYVESLSSYARQFLERMEKPQVDEVEGICPAIAIRQRTLSRSPRSTVATVTEIHDHLRLLFARAGETVCDACGKVVARDSAGSAADRLIGEPEGTPALVGFELDQAPDWRGARGAPASAATAVSCSTGQTIDLEECPPLPSEARPIVLVDRLLLRADERGRLAEALETAYREGHGRAVALLAGGRSRALLGAPRVPRLRPDVRRAGAAPLLVQQPVRGLPDLPRLRERDRDRSRARGARHAQEPGRRAPSSPGTSPTTARCCSSCGASRAGAGSRSTCPGRSSTRGTAGSCSRATRASRACVGFFRWLEGRKYRVQVRAFLARYRGYHECPECARRAAAAGGARACGSAAARSGTCRR